MSAFGVLPSLRLLKLQCNAMTSLSKAELPRFPKLQSLDLSYNALRTEDIEKLSLLPALRELDLSFNTIRKFPNCSVMSRFRKLQKLSLANNMFVNGCSIFCSLSSVPFLQNLDLSHNMLCEVPKDAVGEECFQELKRIDLAHNGFCEAKDLLPLVLIEGLNEVVLGGNPLSTKIEDIHLIQRASQEARDGLGDCPLAILTELRAKGKPKR